MDIGKKIYPYYFRHCTIPRVCCGQQRLVRQIQRKGWATVAFIVSSLPMWRSQELYDLLSKDPRFELFIILHPFRSFSDTERISSIAALNNYFQDKNIPAIDLSNYPEPGNFLRKEINPDIIFYPQPYHNIFENDLDSDFFEDKLICYTHYSQNIIDEGWVYSQRLTNLAWRVFHSSSADKACAEKHMLNKGRNVRIVGNPLADLFRRTPDCNPWKNQDVPKKKLIWAPHYSIMADDLLQRGHFLELSRVMSELKQAYRDTVQFAFKPHPRLLTSLYCHPEWGKEKADAYYASWAEGENSQIETGPYVDLFQTSDAMIHDCCSFSAEYLYTRKPVFYTTENIDLEKKGLHELGMAALDCHYHGLSYDSIRKFIDDVVFEGKDSKKTEREDFYKQYLLPPDGKSVAENIYHEILSGLEFAK